MTTKPSFTNPQEISEAGEKIYKERYQEEHEKLHLGRFAAIDVLSEKIVVADSPESAILEAQKTAPGGLFHLIKIGSPGAFRVSHFAHAGRGWLVR